LQLRQGKQVQEGGKEKGVSWGYSLGSNTLNEDILLGKGITNLLALGPCCLLSPLRFLLS